MRVSRKFLNCVLAVAAFVTIGLVLSVLLGCNSPRTTATVSPTPVASPDPFVGTWIASAVPSSRAVIAKRGTEYVMIAWKGSQLRLRFVFARHGDELVAKVFPPGSGFHVGQPGALLYPASGLLFFVPFGENEKLTRVSSSTAVPTATP